MNRRERRRTQDRANKVAQIAARSFELWRAALQFAASHTPPGGSALDILRFGRSETGTLLEQFCVAHPGLTPSDRTLVARFPQAFSSVFAVQRRGNAMLALRDAVTGQDYTVLMPDTSVAARAVEDTYVATVLAPAGKGWMLGGSVQGVRGDIPHAQLFHVLARLVVQEADRVRATHPGITAQMCRDLHTSFTQAFDHDHITGPPERVLSELNDFMTAWEPPAHHGFANAGSLATDVDLDNAGSVGVIADPDLGISLVERLDDLLLAVRTRDTERVSRLLNEATPAAFRCASRNHPTELRSCLKALGHSVKTPEALLTLLRERQPGAFPLRPSIVPMRQELTRLPPDPGPTPADGIGLAALLLP